MELRTLRYFVEVAHEGNITHAAERLHISQPTLSKQMKELESELGKKLLIRGNYNVRLTDEGMLLRKRAEDILDMVGKTEEEFKALGEITGGDVRIGCAESDSMKYLAQRVKSLQERYPHFRLHLYSGDTEDVEERLDRGVLDFAVLAQEVNLSKYNYLEMPNVDTWGVIMRKDSPLANKEAVHMKDLLNLPLICSRQGVAGDYPKWFGEKVDTLNIIATFNLSYNAAILVQEGIGYLIGFEKQLLNTGADSELCFRPLIPRLETKIHFVWKKYQVFTSAAELLLNEMRKHFDSSLKGNTE